MASISYNYNTKFAHANEINYDLLRANTLFKK